MSKRPVASFRLALFLLTLAASTAAGQRTAGLTAFAGAVFPAQSTLEAGAATGFGLLLPLASRTRLGVHFVDAQLKSIGSQDGLLEGRLTITPFLLFVQQDLVVSQRFKIFLAAGGGLLFAQFRGDFITIPEVTITQAVPTRLAVHLAAGISFSITERLAIFGQAGFLFCRATGRTTIRDMNFGQSQEEFSVNLSSQQSFLGLVYYF
jgi:hypothetical protein